MNFSKLKKVYIIAESGVNHNGSLRKAIEMDIKFFGCDLPSVDISGSKDKPIHNALLGSNIIIYESLTNLDR